MILFQVLKHVITAERGMEGDVARKKIEGSSKAEGGEQGETETHQRSTIF